MNIIPFITTHTTLQSSSDAEYDYVYTDQFNEELVSSIINNSSSIFAAMAKVEEINQLNGYPVFSTYNIRRIRDFYISGNQNCKVINGKSKLDGYKSDFVEKRILERQREIGKEMTKAYIKLLSI